MERNLASDLYNNYSQFVNNASLTDVMATFSRREPYFKQITNRFLPKNKNSSIFDLGCGSGALLFFLQQQGYRDVSGVDTCASEVAFAHQLGLDRVVQGDILTHLEQQKTASFDVVLSFDVLEHLPETQLQKCLVEVERVLKPKGLWLVHVPNATSPFFGRVRYGDITHFRAFTEGSIRQLMNTYGFTDLVVVEDRPVVKGLKSAVRYLLWRGIRALLNLYLLAESGLCEKVLSQNILVIAKKP